MTDLQAALGLVQLRRLPQFHARRRQIVTKYNTRFGVLNQIQTPVERPEVEHAWHLYVLRCNSGETQISRDDLITGLRARNIGSSVHFIPVHFHKYYREKYGYRREDFPVASREYQRIISLPLSPKMSDADVESVISAVEEMVHEHRRPKHPHAKFASA